MLKYFPEESLGNPYVMVADFLDVYIRNHKDYYGDLIVCIETGNLGKSNEICTYWGEFGCFEFHNDWYEGGWIKVHGYTHLEHVVVPEMEGE